MQQNPVVWFEIYVQDMKRARAFYETVLATKLTKLEMTAPDLEEMWTFPMDTNGAGAAGALIKMKGAPSGGGTIVYFGSDDCAIEAGRVEAAGGRLESPKFSVGQYGHVAIALDPDGNRIGFHSMS